jgi:hypothetical protein
MKNKDAPVPWKRRNKFLVAVPWISLTSNPWHSPRSPAPTGTESEY